MSNLPAIPGQSVMPEGLDDTEPGDMTMPIIRIDHDRGVFVDNQSGEEFVEFDGVLLGRLKQRILWPMDPSNEKEQPMCRSYDFITGHPRSATWVQPQKDNKNWTAVKLSGFDFTFVENAETSGEGLACADCPLKDWGQNKTPPWCNEQYTFPFLRVTQNGTSLVPGIVSFQRTGLKACKGYVSSFVTAKWPLYRVITRIRAVVNTRGTVSWVTPSFQRLGESEATMWPDFSRTLAQVTELLRTPRVPQDDPDITAAAAAVPPQQAPAQPRPSAPQQAPAPAQAAPDHPTDVTAQNEQEAAPVGRAQPAATPASAPATDAWDDDEEPF